MTHSNFLNKTKLFFKNDIFTLLVALGIMVLVAGVPMTALAADKSATLKKPQTEQVVSKVNINQADAASLATALNGVGMKKAEAIIAWRAKFGKFVRIEQLMEVKGIGEKTLEKNRSVMSL